MGLGASAGGLAAFEAFFSGMPVGTDRGMAFVLIQHLDPDHESLLTDLIRGYTHMTVLEIEDGMEVEPDRVYVTPPGRDMVLREGRLRLREPAEPRGHRLPIDAFFRSLAEEKRERAIGIVLSGTGADGTLGARAVKEQGGLVLAEDPDSTEYGEMPRSAIATGVVDHVLSAAAISRWLIDDPGAGDDGAGDDGAGDDGAGPRHRPASPAHPPAPKEANALQQVFHLLRERTGHDFTHYKEISIQRRLVRRMHDQGMGCLEEYVRYLSQAPDEVEALFGELLIGVTRFFRDPEAFAALEEKAFSALLEGRPPGSIVRVWVPGCSTGEEAYSIAILVREHLDRTERLLRLQVFATDIDPRAIATARAGVYPASIEDDVTPERLDRHFSREGSGDSYRIREHIRELLVFSEQDLIVDAPFSRIDLISCRNLLIYLEPGLQKKLMLLFHYALNPVGMLFLGTSETVGDFADRFETVDRAAKLYLKKEAPRSSARSLLPRLPAGDDRVRLSRRLPVRTPVPGNRSMRELTERELLAHDAPTAVLVDGANEILYIHGRTGQFLEPAAGEAGMNLLKMARDGLKRDLAAALREVRTRKEPVLRRGLHVRSNGDPVSVDLTVRPVPGASGEGGGPDLFLVTLGEAPRPGSPGEAPVQEGPEGSRKEQEVEGPGTEGSRIAALEGELRAGEETLKALEAEMQTADEEFRSSIQELQSMNEEMQSTNEELATSKEELQSVGEELAALNAELETKVADLSRVETDMNNLLAATGIGTVFLDPELRIQRFTPASTELLNLIGGDVGRPLSDLTSRLDTYTDLAADAKAVLDTLIPREAEVRTHDGVWYLLRIRPYRTVENAIEGAVITFTEITEVKQAREAVRESEALRRLAVIVQDAHDAITVQDPKGRLQAWNPAAERMYGWTEAEALEMPYEAIVPTKGRAEARTMLARLESGEGLEPSRTTRITKNGKRLRVWLTATPLIGETGKVYGLATTERLVERSALEPGRQP